MQILSRLSISLFLIFWIVAPLSAEYSKVRPGYVFQFPRDHAAHMQYPMEWWYLTGHLENSEQETYGFEFTIFRVGVDDFRVSDSPWKSRNMYVVHGALTDDRGQKYFFKEEYVRENFNLVQASQEKLLLKLAGHELSMQGNQIFLNAKISSGNLQLRLEPKKPLVLHGKDGYSQKSDENGNASLYMSFTNLQGIGELERDGKTETVKAKAWMDHEVMSSTVQRSTAAWDWFAIQLDDESEIMLYHLKNDQGEISKFSQGSFIDVFGKKTQLKRQDFSIEALEYWRSPQTGIRYPSRWKIKVPKKGLALTVIPTVKNQEFRSPEISKNYWEGRSLVYDDDRKVGQAYVELVGW